MIFCIDDGMTIGGMGIPINQLLLTKKFVEVEKHMVTKCQIYPQTKSPERGKNDDMKKLRAHMARNGSSIPRNPITF